jgi:DNA ligase-associated metallophosphoesterase
MHHALFFHGETLHLLPSGGLHWPARNLLAVSDLHLGKSERLARRGGTLLPPYETQATLEKLDRDLEDTRADTVICVGDSFDDLAAADGIDEPSLLWLNRLIAGRDWTWITGNHDPGPIEIGGSHRADHKLQPFTFRHIAEPMEKAEISGHYHPKARLAGQSRPCFLADAARLILPAYGVYTGGLRSHDPALATLMAQDALAILTGPRVLAIPMPRQGRR